MMLVDVLKDLKSLHQLDEQCFHLNHLLQQAPLDKESFERKIKALESLLKIALENYQKKELHRKSIDKQLLECEQSIIKYKTSQAVAKKNEELLALDHQIQIVKQTVSNLEEEGLLLLDDLEEAAKKLALLQETTKAEITHLKQKIQELHEKEILLKQQCEALKIEIEQSKSTIDNALLLRYETTKKRVLKPPFLIPCKEQRCQGCFVKLSQDVVSEIIAVGYANCYQCGRLLYI